MTYPGIARRTKTAQQRRRRFDRIIGCFTVVLVCGDAHCSTETDSCDEAATDDTRGPARVRFLGAEASRSTLVRWRCSECTAATTRCVLASAADMLAGQPFRGQNGYPTSDTKDCSPQRGDRRGSWAWSDSSCRGGVPTLRVVTSVGNRRAAGGTDRRRLLRHRIRHRAAGICKTDSLYISLVAMRRGRCTRGERVAESYAWPSRYCWPSPSSGPMAG